jgi:hypothetical protein
MSSKPSDIAESRYQAGPTTTEMADIVFTDAAIDDLRRIGPGAVPKVLKKLLLLEENAEAGYPLGGELTGDPAV